MTMITRSEPPERTPLPMKSSTSPSCSRTISPSTTCPALNSSLCAGKSASLHSRLDEKLELTRDRCNCSYMNINAFGTDNFLRYTIRSRMRQIKEDDKVRYIACRAFGPYSELSSTENAADPSPFFLPLGASCFALLSTSLTQTTIPHDHRSSKPKDSRPCPSPNCNTPASPVESAPSTSQRSTSARSSPNGSNCTSTAD